MAPGYIATQINVDYGNASPEPEITRARAAARQPMNRTGSVDEVALPTLFLAANEAGYITGAMLVIDGGGSLFYG